MHQLDGSVDIDDSRQLIEALFGFYGAVLT